MIQPFLLEAYKSFHPLVDPVAQRLVCAQNFENSWVVGRFYHTFTNSKFFNWAFNGNHLSDEDYTFELVSNSPAFAVSEDGIITVADISQFTSSQTLTIRCHAKDIYHQDGQLEIVYIPTPAAVYLDATAAPGGDGTKTSPYNRFRSVPQSGIWSQGKSFFYKSGTTTTEEYMTVLNTASDPYTNFARWGVGARPLIDLSSNLSINGNVLRFMDFGSFSEGEVAGQGHNVRVIEVDFYSDCSSAFYPFQIQNWSKNLEIRNSKMEGLIFPNGFIWSRAVSGYSYDPDERRLFFFNLEFSDFRDLNGDGTRNLKMEGYGNICRNCKSVSSHTGSNSAPISLVDQEGGDCEFLYMDTRTAENTLGPNIRKRKQTYRRCYIAGPNNGLVIFNNHLADHQTNPIDGTSYFEACLVEDCKDRGVFFSGTENTSWSPPTNTVGIRGVIARECGVGIDFIGGVRNVVAVSCQFTGNTENGVRHISGSLNGLFNCTVVGNGGNDINVISGNLTAGNTLFGDVIGTLNQITSSNDVSGLVGDGNFRLTEQSSLIGAGTYFYSYKDIVGMDFKNPPSIGAFEFVTQEPTPPPSGVMWRGKRFVLG